MVCRRPRGCGVHELEVKGRIDAKVVNVHHLPVQDGLKLAEHVRLCVGLGRHAVAGPFVRAVI